MKDFQTELLAPAKDKETAIAAINAGADAIYIGAGNFGARKNAANSINDIKEIVEYAHKFYVKVFVTINTILTDSELEKAKELINELYEIKTDAIIVQDMGILELAANNELPPIPIHISTQCNNRTVEKVKFFEQMGLPRVILAREMSLNQIKNITTECPNTEIETFIHGALCVSYSGQCYLSRFIGGRSANRGECAQPCRKKYSLVNEKGEYWAKEKHLLSLKDFNASKHIEELVKSKVKSFKIEGRLKDKYYVQNTVLYYRQLLDKFSKKDSSGEILTEFKPNIHKTFNRGFTTYFLNEREECFNFASPKSIGEKIGILKKSCGKFYLIDTKKSLSPQDGLCFFSKDGELKGFAINKIEGNKIFPNTYSTIDENTEIYRNSDTIFEKELESCKITRKISTCIKVENDTIILSDEDNNLIKVPLKSGEQPQNPLKAKETFIKQISKLGDTIFSLKRVEINQPIDFYPISAINEIRRDAFEALTKEREKNYHIRTQKTIKYAKYPEQNPDYRANILNKKAMDFYKKSGATPSEYALEQNIPQRNNVELMRTKHCLKWAFNKCKAKENLFLVDEKGCKFPLKFDCKNCEMVVLMPQNYSDSTKKP